ncbi:FMN-binding glutamate synthase family protein [Flavobacterium lindanitolerans]|jgi:glutamate synthase domain-containing protein 2|uniref:Glutamate synthase domain-containing protein 2 n=1 Tax=Flavobacterium lindanitolerans TaxID=428988 RepID=A0A497U6R0_9FLAO|nr:FMN-binding glutamate synthase family protein [Flavobacterium lindanitolerans]PKW20585.1 glutamate synthase domain-containing protein 2 [Flavobacterium lindanitolerans]RLJ24028.1 glutamate synthase domain-containing protein 2 [Flavobacterium lindanitolerans]
MRKAFVVLSITVLAIIGIMTYINWKASFLLLIFIPLIIMGLYDMFQSKKTIRRNFPLVGRMRYLLESLGPGVRQYFIEKDLDGKPFNRLERSLVYQRSKKETDSNPFGTQLDIYEVGYQWINHSIKAIPFSKVDSNPRIRIGSSQCEKPYDASLYNISAMSFGSLSRNAIQALNAGAKQGGFYHNTGEGGLSPYHLEGGDVVWNIGTGYFSCRDDDGNFSYEQYAKRAVLDNVKMIEIKFSQGAKPGHGGILPKEKVTDEIAAIRLVSKGKDIISPPTHSAFSTPLELMDFIKLLRKGSGGKPIGMKICIGNKSEFIAICKAMVETETYFDFITVDGGEGGTGAAPQEYSDHVGMPLRDALAFVYDCLVGFGIKNQIKIICSGKIITGFDIIKTLATGADLCNSARGMMFALGCIQALECHANTCPTGVATQDPRLVKGLVPEEKSIRVARFQHETVKSAMELMASAGICHPDEVDRHVVSMRVDRTKIQTFAETYPELENGCLLNENTVPENFRSFWKKAAAASF